ncbi:hypothetical protein [Rhizobium sp. BR 362]
MAAVLIIIIAIITKTAMTGIIVIIATTALQGWKRDGTTVTEL